MEVKFQPREGGGWLLANAERVAELIEDFFGIYVGAVVSWMVARFA